MVADQDRQHFETFGFVTWRGLLSPAEVTEIEAELMAAMTEAHAAAPFDGTKRHWLPLLNTRTPKIASLAEDPRFYAKAKELVGGDVVLMVADGNRYVSATGWHPDGKPGLRGVKFFVYLGELGADTGALRVVPGSHKQPLHGGVGEIAASITDVDEVPGYVFDCQPGDVLAFDFPMWHASKGGTTDRRMCTIEYYRAPADPVDAAAVNEHMRLVVEVTREAFPDSVGYPFYDAAWLAAADGDLVHSEIVEGMRSAGLLEIAGLDPLTVTASQTALPLTVIAGKVNK